MTGIEYINAIFCYTPVPNGNLLLKNDFHGELLYIVDATKSDNRLREKWKVVRVGIDPWSYVH